MIQKYKSVLGIGSTIIYMLCVFYAVIEGYGFKPQPMDSFALLIITAPWSFLLLITLESVGVITEQNGDSFIFLLVMFGALINLLILYLLGYLITRIIHRIGT
jgi:hypothetical protein